MRYICYSYDGNFLIKECPQKLNDNICNEFKEEKRRHFLSHQTGSSHVLQGKDISVFD